MASAPAASSASRRADPAVRAPDSQPAILEAVDGVRRVHILDLDAAHGVQWPALLQAIIENADAVLGPPEVRITGADHGTLLRTGNRLRDFARSIHLPFHFTPLLLSVQPPACGRKWK